jgi:hypothetical protein
MASRVVLATWKSCPRASCLPLWHIEAKFFAILLLTHLATWFVGFGLEPGVLTGNQL